MHARGCACRYEQARTGTQKVAKRKHLGLIKLKIDLDSIMMFIPNNAQKLPLENLSELLWGLKLLGCLGVVLSPTYVGYSTAHRYTNTKLPRSFLAGVACKAFLRYILILCTPVIKGGPA